VMEGWSLIAISENEGKIAVILGNPVMINAYKEGTPANGKPFPNGSKMAKAHWNPKKQDTEPGQPTVPGTQHDVDFMVKDSKRFADSGGWGWGAFEYDAASDTFSPATTAAKPPPGVCPVCAGIRKKVFARLGRPRVMCLPGAPSGLETQAPLVASDDRMIPLPARSLMSNLS
jgi:Cytochrome P460